MPLLQTSTYEPGKRERSIFTQSKMPIVDRNTFGCIKSDNYKIIKGSKRDKNASEYISNQLHRLAQLVRNSKFSRNDSKIYLSDASTPSSE